jgi:oligopeptidase A
MTNPLLYFKKNNLIDFGAVQAEHFAPAINKLLADYAQVIEQVCALEELTWENLIDPLDQISAKFDIAWSTISHLSNVTSTEQIREQHEKLLPIVSKFMTDVMHNQKLFMQIKKLTNSPEYQKLTPTQQHILTMHLRDFELSGIGLDAKSKAKFSVLSEELSQITNKFGINVMDAVQKWSLHIAEEDQERLRGIPQHIIQNAQAKAAQHSQTGYILGLDSPTYFSVISYADDRQLRQQFYEAYCTRATAVSGADLDNSLLIEQILQLRQELAQLVGFKNYAEYSLATKMADSPETVLQFLRDLAAKAKQPAIEQLTALKTFAKEQGLQDELKSYDLGYYAEKYQRLTYNIDQESLRPYFPSQKVIRGMFDVAEKLYGIKIIDLTAEFSHALWHSLVNIYAVYENDKLLGYFYTDLYAREQKRDGAWMDDLFNRMRLANGQIQLPVVFLCCNFAPPVNGQGLLTHDDVLTAFHEFGHSLHGLLTKVDYVGASGLNGVPWDGVELPSQFFENWAWQYDVIKKISGHYLSGEVLPLAIFNNLFKTKIYNSGLMILRNIEYSLFDMLIHSNIPENHGKTVQQILDEIRAEIAVVKPPKLNKFQNAFTHIFDGGYAAGYYSYLWADVLSCDAFSYFASNGIYDDKLGKSFKENILEKGGSADFMVLYKNYAHKEPDLIHLLEHYGLI